MFSYDKTGARLQKGKLVADDGTEFCVNGKFLARSVLPKDLPLLEGFGSSAPLPHQLQQFNLQQ